MGYGDARSRLGRQLSIITPRPTLFTLGLTAFIYGSGSHALAVTNEPLLGPWPAETWFQAGYKDQWSWQAAGSPMVRKDGSKVLTPTDADPLKVGARVGAIYRNLVIPAGARTTVIDLEQECWNWHQRMSSGAFALLKGQAAADHNTAAFKIGNACMAALWGSGCRRRAIYGLVPWEGDRAAVEEALASNVIGGLDKLTEVRVPHVYPPEHVCDTNASLIAWGMDAFARIRFSCDSLASKNGTKPVEFILGCTAKGKRLDPIEAALLVLCARSRGFSGEAHVWDSALGLANDTERDAKALEIEAWAAENEAELMAAAA